MSAPLAAAHRFWRARLPGSWVPDHLAARGFPPAVPRRWEIGYAPAARRALTDELRGLGFTDEEIVACGLARRDRQGELYDLFRDRAMFTIRDAAGSIAGFLGRRTDGGRGPKYLNSPASPRFRKSALLFGLHEARDRLAEGGRPVLVEGPFDVIAVSLAGHAAVAPCGTFCTAGQLAALAAVADLDSTGVLVALDGDAGGRRGVLRAGDVLARIAGPVDVMVPPDGQDPADLLRHGGRTAVRAALRTTVPLFDLIVDAAVERAARGTTPEDRLAAVRAATAAIVRMRPAEATRQVARVAYRLDVPHVVVTEALTAAVTGG
jgi:DNA primase